MMKDAVSAPLLPGIKPVLELLLDAPQRIDLVYCRKGLRSREAQQIQELCRANHLRYTLVEGAALDRLCRASCGGAAPADGKRRFGGRYVFPRRGSGLQ